MIDDYGTGQYVCHYTHRLVSADEAVIVGTPLPGVKVQFVIAKDAMPLHKESARLFHESEANCNMCRHLVRTAHPKYHVIRFGSRDLSFRNPLLGTCGRSGERLKIHPEDPMHKGCWEARA